MKNLLLDIPLTNSVLKNTLTDYARPNDKISYMMEKGELIGLAKGHYAYQQTIEKNIFINHQVANVIYGPSYISKFSALSYYGLLSESTTLIESMTLKRAKKIENPLGIFDYSSQPNKTVFAIGINSHKINDTTTILIATPEKAICDIIWSTPHLLLRNINDLTYFLEEDIRMEISVLQHANLSDIQYCLTQCKKKIAIRLLYNLISKIKNDVTRMV